MTDYSTRRRTTAFTAAALCGWLVPAGAARGGTPAGSALRPPEVSGAAGKRELRSAPGVAYHDVPAADELELEVEGPVIVVLDIVAHRPPKGGDTVSLMLSRNGGDEERITVPCLASADRFASARPGGIVPCAPVTRRIPLGEGEHTLALRLGRADHGASIRPSLEAVAEAAKAIDDLALVPIVPSRDAPTSAAASPAAGTAPVIVAAPAAAAAPPPALALSTAPPPPAGPPLWQRLLNEPAVWGPAAGAVAATGAAAVFGMLSRNAFDDAAGAAVQTRRIDLNNQGRDRARTANVLFGAAGVSLVAAAVMAALEL